MNIKKYHQTNGTNKYIIYLYCNENGSPSYISNIIKLLVL